MINQKIRDLFKNFYFLFFLSFILWMTIIDSNGFINRYRLSKKLSELNTQKEFYVKEINKVTSKISSKELEQMMDNEGISASICNELNEVYLDPQVIDQNSIVEIEHPDLGIMRMSKPPANLKGQEIFPRSLAPILGFDNREVLSAIEIDNDTIDRMEAREKQNREMLASLMQAAEE